MAIETIGRSAKLADFEAVQRNSGRFAARLQPGDAEPLYWLGLFDAITVTGVSR